MTRSGFSPDVARPARLTLVLGGARAGKSAYAERLIARARAEHPVYVATAQPGDAEMARRIAEHRRRRGDFWRTVEAPLDLAAAIAAHANPHTPVLIDCLTLWLSNLMAASRDLDRETTALAESLERAGGPVVLVSNEVGSGIVPDNALARDFRDAAGRLHQAIAVIADRVVFVTAGLPLVLKDDSAPALAAVG